MPRSWCCPEPVLPVEPAPPGTGAGAVVPDGRLPEGRLTVPTGVVVDVVPGTLLDGVVPVGVVVVVVPVGRVKEVSTTRVASSGR